MHPRPRLPVRPVRHAAACALLLSLAACGGGSGDDEGASPAESARPASDASGTADASATADAPAAPSPVDPLPVSDPVPSGPAVALPGQSEGNAETAPVEATSVETGASPGIGDFGIGDDDSPLPRNDVREVDAVYPYRADGPWAESLARCALVEEFETACPLTELPFIAQATPSPSVEDVLDRLLVTHDWMGERFEEALRRAPEGLVQLFAPTTSITIGSTVRPSYYTGLTGGVRLDPDYLWQTVEEKATVSIDEDFRAPFQSLLDFRDVSARLVGRELAYEYFPLDDRSERTFEQSQKLLLTLLYHELAHANDFLPPGTAVGIDSSLRPFEALDANQDRWLSPRLQAQYPQASTLLPRLAEIRFRGEEPTAEEAALEADAVGAEFANDGGLDFYSYLTIREDFAQLFEAAMMKAIFDVDMHYAFTSLPADPEDFGCDELLVGWGERNRLGDPAVAERAGWAVASIYGPSAAVDDFVAARSGTAEPMEPGTDFCTNLPRDPALASRLARPGRTRAARADVRRRAARARAADPPRRSLKSGSAACRGRRAARPAPRPSSVSRAPSALGRAPPPRAPAPAARSRPRAPTRSAPRSGARPRRRGGP